MTKIGFVSSDKPDAQKSLNKMKQKYKMYLRKMQTLLLRLEEMAQY